MSARECGGNREGNGVAKKKRTKEELKEERRRAMEAKRGETGWEPPEPDLEPDELELERERVVEDALVLFPDLGSESSMHQEMSGYLAAIVDSEWMVDEPEFEAIYFSPPQLLQRYIEEAEAAEFDPASLEELDEEEGANRHAELLSAAIDDMLTEAMAEDILDAIELLRERLIEDGEREQAARAGLVLDFLETGGSSVMWPRVGVVHGLGQRSLEAGWALTRAATETDQIFREDGAELTPEWQEVLEKYPGLVESMAIHHDRTWEDGVEALFTGDLWLGVFHEDELEQQLETWERALEHDKAGEKEEADARVEEISHYTASLLTTERVGEMMAHLETLHENEPLDPEEAEFVGLLRAALMDEETVREGVAALVTAFFGELGLLWEERQGEAEWEEGE